MSFWIILSWVLVAIFTAVNVVVFLKLKSASEQMLKMAFPGAKDMNEALAQMQSMTRNLPKNFGRGGGSPFTNGAPKGAKGSSDAQLKAAMDMLKNMQKGSGKR